MQTIKTLRGYTTQARYYAFHMLNDATGDTFVVIGYTSVLANERHNVKSVKPVYQTLAGQRVVLLDGKDHLTVLVCELDKDADVRADEMDFYPAQAVR